ncbi:hypothetical protein [Acetobacter fallax]|uniref:Lipoprotein n=1 Tax=Acetobacter fallax TaxID=1737473 RepID=A0ABX0K739_9PROT|nr:hypothetical protein [Acetobacter fallax]NHO32215.1 hypothetical protein [Acetobacter fallax]NHO35732.1 hypothetical protein [Acetobacter fallax]
MNRSSSFLHTLRFGPVLLGCLALAACMPQRFQVVAANQSVTSTGQFTDVSSIGGRPVPLQSIVILEPDCTPAGTAIIQVQTPPAHGQITTETGNYYPSYPASDSQRYACNLKKRAGVAAIYTPEPGFHGVVFATLQVTGPLGRSGTRVYRITVQ